MSCCCQIPVEPIRFATYFVCDFDGNLLYCRDRGGNSKDVVVIGDNILEGGGSNVLTSPHVDLNDNFTGYLGLSSTGGRLYTPTRNLSAALPPGFGYARYLFEPKPATDPSWDGAALGIHNNELFDITDPSAFTLRTPDGSEAVFHTLPAARSWGDSISTQYRFLAENTAGGEPYLLFERTIFYYTISYGVVYTEYLSSLTALVVVDWYDGSFIKTVQKDYPDCGAAVGDSEFTGFGQQYRQGGNDPDAFIDLYPDSRRWARQYVYRFPQNGSDVKETLRLYESATSCPFNNIPSSILDTGEILDPQQFESQSNISCPSGDGDETASGSFDSEVTYETGLEAENCENCEDHTILGTLLELDLPELNDTQLGHYEQITYRLQGSDDEMSWDDLNETLQQRGDPTTGGAAAQSWADLAAVLQDDGYQYYRVQAVKSAPGFSLALNAPPTATDEGDFYDTSGIEDLDFAFLDGTQVDLSWTTPAPGSRTDMDVEVTGETTLTLSGGTGDDLPNEEFGGYVMSLQTPTDSSGANFDLRFRRTHCLTVRESDYNSGGGGLNNATFSGTLMYDEANDRYVGIGFSGIGPRADDNYEPCDIRLVMVVWDASTLEPISFGHSAFNLTDLTASAERGISPNIFVSDIDGVNDTVVLAINGAARDDTFGNWILSVDISDAANPAVNWSTETDEQTQQIHMLTDGQCLAYHVPTQRSPYGIAGSAEFGDVGLPGAKVCLAKYDSDGTVLWNVGLSAEGTLSRIIADQGNTDIWVAGSWNVVHDGRNHQRHVARISLDDGTTLWSATRLPVPGGRGRGYINDMIVHDNQLILVGIREPAGWTLFEEPVFNVPCESVVDYDCELDLALTGGCCLSPQLGCYADGDMVTECECREAGGTWLGEDVPCDTETTPSCLPCDNEHTGGCCGGLGFGCLFDTPVTECVCDVAGGQWMGIDVPCDEDDGCEITGHVCCGPPSQTPFDNTGCYLISFDGDESNCDEIGGHSFHEGSNDCGICGCQEATTGYWIWDCTGEVFVLSGDDGSGADCDPSHPSAQTGDNYFGIPCEEAQPVYQDCTDCSYTLGEL